MYLICCTLAHMLLIFKLPSCDPYFAVEVCSIFIFYVNCLWFFQSCKNKTDWAIMCINKSLAVFSLMVHLAKLVVTFWWLFLGYLEGDIWDRCRIGIMECVVILYYNTLVLLSLKEFIQFLIQPKKVLFFFFINLWWY